MQQHTLGIYDGNAVSFTLHHAGAFAFNFTRSASSDPFDITIAPAGFGATTQNVALPAQWPQAYDAVNFHDIESVRHAVACAVFETEYSLSIILRPCAQGSSVS